MASLYEIDNAILECVDLETGEILDAERLNELQIERESKLESVALWYKNILSDAAAYKAEKDSFAEKEKVAKNKAESIKRYLDNALQGENFKTTKVAVSFRKSEQVDIEEGAELPEEYLRFKEPEADKTKIKQALKEGIKVLGCSLVENRNIQIK